MSSAMIPIAVRVSPMAPLKIDPNGLAPTETTQYRTLIQAIDRGDVEGVKTWLADAGSNAEALLQSNPSPLSHAVYTNHEVIVCMLLEKDALGSSHLGKQPPPGAVGRRFTHHPLRAAVEYGHIESVRALLRYGAVPEPDLLGAACGMGRLDIVDLLLGAGADVDARPEAPKPKGRTALMQAAGVGDAAVVAVLLGRGAKPNLGHDEPGGTALQHAERAGHADVVLLLTPFKLPALVDILTDIDAAGGVDAATSALIRWVTNGGEASHRFIARMEEGRVRLPLLVYAAMQGNDSAVATLLKSNALVDATILGEPTETNADGQTALLRAAIGGFPTIIEMLLAAGADPSHRSASGETALTTAEKRATSSKPHAACVAVLRQAAAGLSEKRSESREALAALSELRVAIDAASVDGLRAATANHSDSQAAYSPQVAHLLKEAHALLARLCAAAAAAEKVASDMSTASTLEEVRAAFMTEAAESVARVAELASGVTRAHALAAAAHEAMGPGTVAVPAEALGQMRAQVAAQARMLAAQSAQLGALGRMLAEERAQRESLSVAVGSFDGRVAGAEASARAAADTSSKLDRQQQARVQEEARTKHFFVLKQRQQLQQQEGLVEDVEQRVAAVELQLSQLNGEAQAPQQHAMQMPEMQMHYQMVAPQTQWHPIAFMPHSMSQQHYGHDMQPHYHQMQQHHAMSQMCAMSQQSAQQAHHVAPHYLQPADQEEICDVDDPDETSA